VVKLVLICIFSLISIFCQETIAKDITQSFAIYSPHSDGGWVPSGSIDIIYSFDKRGRLVKESSPLGESRYTIPKKSRELSSTQIGKKKIYFIVPEGKVYSDYYSDVLTLTNRKPKTIGSIEMKSLGTLGREGFRPACQKTFQMTLKLGGMTSVGLSCPDQWGMPHWIHLLGNESAPEELLLRQ
jgi:hypothetical protein